MRFIFANVMLLLLLSAATLFAQPAGHSVASTKPVQQSVSYATTLPSTDAM